jgi:hypothetical protein
LEGFVATSGQTRKLDDVPAAWNALTETVIGAAMEVHRTHSGRFPLGLLLNFNVPRLKDGIYRRILSSASHIPRHMLEDQS